MERVILTPLTRIPGPRGGVLHAMKSSDPGYIGFGEAYFSEVLPGVVKGWKRHTRMTLNLVVPIGRVRFALHDGTLFRDVLLSPKDDKTYQRLTVPPGLWMAFRGEGTTASLVLNIADIRHDPDEAQSRGQETFPWRWPLEMEAD